ncbi:MAG: MerR family transcriptional regulator [Chloroflexi bacterium]|jgi:DNA-binding transcriptional MerR regulator|nr:MerR family transcriptional regulator [Chloroflexota bacterium]MBT5627861.1 MerR family transcriptional regulator [Chloroflexota bacterium]
MTSSGNTENLDNAASNSGDLAVGELSKRTGVTTATINYYVRIGVLPPPRKTSQTRALYPADFENRINKIKELQAAGLNLKGIKQVVNGDPSSPLASAMPADRPGATTAQSTSSGPISISEFLSQSGLDDDLYDSLVSANLIRRPRTGPDGAPAHDRRDLSAARAFARLTAAGIEYPLLERHAEYNPLSKAEALFLAEHLSSATRVTPSTQPVNLVAAFDAIRRYLRSLQLDEAYPDWRNPQS